MVGSTFQKNTTLGRLVYSQTQLCLDVGVDTRVADTEQTAGGRTRREPVAGRETFYQRHKVCLEIRRRMLTGDSTKALDRLLAHDRLFYRREALQRRLTVK